MQRRGRRAPDVTTAKHLAYERGLYDWTDEFFVELPVDTLDGTFNPYERRLPAAIAAVSNAGDELVPLELWMKVLLPYVAGLTVRHPAFLAKAGASGLHVLLQSSRWMEMSRALAPLMAAEWIALTAPDEASFVVNDRGFAWTYQAGRQRLGILVPVSSSLCLVVLPRAERLIALETEEGWGTPIRRRMATVEDVGGVNSAMAADAIEWLAGPSEDSVCDLPFRAADLNRSALGGPGWPDRGPLGQHDMDWWVVAELVGLPVGRDDWQPFAVLSSVEPGVRLTTVDGRRAIDISFLRPQDPGLV